MSTWSRAATLSMYRTMLRKSKSLEYTDKDFYTKKIKKEFRKNKEVANTAEKARLFQVLVLIFTIINCKQTNFHAINFRALAFVKTHEI